MAKIVVNTGEERYRGLVDPGLYESVCTNVDVIKVSSDPTGSREQLIWTFEISWKDHIVEVVRFTPLSGKGVTFTRETLDALGVKYEETGKSIAFDSEDCLGRFCNIKISNTFSQRMQSLQNSVDAAYAITK